MQLWNRLESQSSAHVLHVVFAVDDEPCHLRACRATLGFSDYDMSWCGGPAQLHTLNVFLFGCLAMRTQIMLRRCKHLCIVGPSFRMSALILDLLWVH
jgi:hypothetical protein